MDDKADVLSEVIKKIRLVFGYDEERGFTSVKGRSLQISKPTKIEFVIYKHRKITTRDPLDIPKVNKLKQSS